MGSIGRWLFGGGESQQTSTPQDLTPPAFRGLQSPLAAGLTTAFQQPRAYTGDLFAPVPTAATNILGQAEGLGGGVGGDLLRRTAAGAFLPGGPQGNPFLEAAIRTAQRPTLQGLEDVLGRTLPGMFTAAGQLVGGGLRAPPTPGQAGPGEPGPRIPGSTAFDLAAARAIEGARGTLGDIATNISNQAYGLERGFQQGTIPLSQSEVQVFLENAKAQLWPQLIADLGPQRAQAQFNETTKALLQALQIATSAAQPTVAGSSTGRSESTTGIIPAIGTLLGGRANRQASEGSS